MSQRKPTPFQLRRERQVAEAIKRGIPPEIVELWWLTTEYEYEVIRRRSAAARQARRSNAS